MFGFSSKQTLELPTKLKSPAQAGFDSMLGKVIVPALKFSKKLVEVPAVAVSLSRIVNDSAVPGGTVIVTSKSALSPGRRLLPDVAESVELSATRVFVKVGDATVVLAVSEIGENRGPPGVEA